MLRIADLLTDSGNFLSWQMARQKYNLGNRDIMKWLSLIASVPLNWKVEIRNYFSSIEETCTLCTPTIPQPKVSPLPDMSVKAAYKILIRPLVKAPISQKSLEKLLCRQDLDWASIPYFRGLAPWGAYRFSKFLLGRLIEQGRLSKLMKI